ncbi:MAG: hypothetical protein K2X03_28165 [Bryobacteraceae bacterium]|nr:hypothetical protein [Bryobacteraceae bacterium]
MAGETAMLKEQVIALEVYERGPDYDPSKDSTVRAEASRLRRALADYYDGHDGPSAIRIEVPKGSYVPIFVTAEQAQTLVSSPIPARGRPKWFSLVVITALVGVAVWGVKLWSRGTSSPNPEAVRLLVQASDAFAADQRSRIPKAGVGRELQDALRLFQQATVADPAYAAAWAGLARSRYEAARCDRTHLLAWIRQSRQAAEQATRLDPRQAVGLTVQARIAYCVDFDLLAAEKLYARGIPLDPLDDEASEEYVDLLGQLGKPDEAKTLIANQLSLAPQHQHWRIQQAKQLILEGRIEEAEQQIASAVLADPRQLAFASVLNGRGSWRQNDAGAAAKYSADVLKKLPWNRGALHHQGLRAAEKRDLPEVQRIIDRLHERMDLGRSAEYTLSSIYEELGDHAQALHWLAEAVRYRDPAVVFVTPRDITPIWLKRAEQHGELTALMREFPAWAKLLNAKY